MTNATSNKPVDNAGRARKILRSALKGSLGTLRTLDDGTELPYVSLVLSATDPAGAPLLLLSKLALHTQNIIKSGQASLMLDDTEGLDEPLTGGRLSLSGRIYPCLDEICRQRYLMRHESSALYADFADFSFYRFEMTHAHFVGGFGAIHDFKREDLLVDISQASGLIGDEADIVEHMNAEHGDVVALIASKLNGENAGPWRLTGIDPAGCDLMMGFKSLRHEFTTEVATADEARQRFIELAKLARMSG